MQVFRLPKVWDLYEVCASRYQTQRLAPKLRVLVTGWVRQQLHEIQEKKKCEIMFV
jgi:hypothetical protein